MLGKLTWDALPFDQPIPMIASGVVVLGILAILGWVVIRGHLPYLWREWITSVDHKRIGVMYTLLAMVMLLRGFADAIMMRMQQSVAFHSQGFLPPEHYDQIFSAHGTIMIFFVAMPFMIGLMNFVLPLQLGVRDVAFPTLNSVGFWLTATGALLINISLVIGEFARNGWLPYPPLSELAYSPGVGTLVAGVNLVTTVLKVRTKGMNYLRMPMFCWTTLATNLLIVAAFPTLNSVGFWLTATGALLINISLVIGEFARNGWLPYPPLSELAYSPGVGIDYYLWSLEISGVGTLVAGVNLVTTVLKVRTKGMNYLRMPMFCWTTLATNLLIVAAFPILTATLAMLLLDRYLGFHFFTNEAGGNAMMFVNLIWTWGHPEVYILVLPAFGIFSEVISTFSGKPLFGYRSMVLATMAICILSFMVWLHHFFTMGAGADVNAIFGIATMIIAVPTGVKVFNWLFTMYGGRIRFQTPLLWSIGFMVTFIIGGMTGVLMAVPPVAFVLHNSLFLVAHFHNVLIGGMLFGAFAGYTYWFPKAFGFRLHEGLGKAAFWCWLVGFYVAFMPLYVVGLLGMTRRMQHYDVPEWHPWLIVAACGAAVIMCGIALQIAQLVVSIRQRAQLRDETGDPWNGRSLEWATASPPPAFNFAFLPEVTGEDAFWQFKRRAAEQPRAEEKPEYQDIEIPRNSPTGFVCAFFATVMGFALIWHIWWMVAVGAIGAFATFVVFAWRDHDEDTIPADEVARIDRSSGAQRHAILSKEAAE
jgi:cytochrome o ubiquinol oxidase subunit 1